MTMEPHVQARGSIVLHPNVGRTSCTREQFSTNSPTAKVRGSLGTGIDEFGQLLDRKFNEKLLPLKDDLKSLKSRLINVEQTMATKEDLKGMATKDDLKGMATKKDLKALKKELIKEISYAVGETVLDSTGGLIEEHEQRISRLEKHTGLPPLAS